VHDYHAVRALVEVLTDELGAEGAGRVARVHVRPDATLSPEALTLAYEMLTAGTPLDGSRLVVEEPDPTECPACGAWWAPTYEHLAGPLIVCPACGALSGVGGATGIRVLEIAVAGPDGPSVASV
jgi:Zn finger protein HypA/HybF involved in hydrogenase expression